MGGSVRRPPQYRLDNQPASAFRRPIEFPPTSSRDTSPRPCAADGAQSAHRRAGRHLPRPDGAAAVADTPTTARRTAARACPPSIRPTLAAGGQTSTCTQRHRTHAAHGPTLVAYRQYPRGRSRHRRAGRAAALLARRLQTGTERNPQPPRRLPAPDPAERAGTWMQPAQRLPVRGGCAPRRANWARSAASLHGLRHRTYARCAPMVGRGSARPTQTRSSPAAVAEDRNGARPSRRTPKPNYNGPWRYATAPTARGRGRLAGTTPAPVATATPPACCARCCETKDRPPLPGWVALGLMFDQPRPPPASRGDHGGVGAELDLAVGTAAVPTFTDA